MAKARSALAVSAIDRDEVGHWLSAHGTPQQVSLRGQILAAADGPSDSAIARALAINRKTVTLWRARYAAGGLESLWERRPCRTPPGMPHWSFVGSATLGCIKVPSGAGKMDIPIETTGQRRSSRRST